MGNFDLLSLFVTQPPKAFDALDERPRFWFPLLLAIVVGLVTTLWYFKVVDLTWLLDESTRNTPRMAAMTEEQRRAVAHVVIDSGGSLEETRAATDALWETLTAD